ncbi:PREDICTED: uncharacterized protein LOC108558749 [Nicrophorus vespilloides]|uniref:Uncharacterized protein LOC108558749 n=1 Tax=Nicrophorus vespilloides TaxID=110193 RepID=A0ABM1M9K0_NICVS|nr:PREDICTED: uncharacterized protein LOC108558749 [Nicrophorus vespilloides]
MLLRTRICAGSCVCFLLMTVVSASPWASAEEERLDELRDAEIYDAVVVSMNEFHRRQTRNGQHRKRVRREDPSVCYDDVGCFAASGPFSYLDTLPSSPVEVNTRFLLYPAQSKRRSGNPPGEVPFHNLTDAFVWAKQGFNNSLTTKVMIHGFGSDCTHIWVYEMRSALMAVEEANVICVDWGNGALLPNYVKATANTRLVGKQLAMLLRGLVEQVGFSLRKMHLIGFSLGAHVAGFAGAELGNLSRITGLDPAGPLFESQDPRARLDQTDADFVDVIHSNGENLILGGLGSWQPMGHVDFYPNGGRMQKGCTNIFVGAVSDIIWSSAVEGRSLCNHRRAYKFFTDSVSPRCHFPAFPCSSYEDFIAGKCFPCTEDSKCGNMGYYSDRSKGRGQLYLITRDEEPFCAHQYHIKIESSPSDVPIVSYGKIEVTLIGNELLNETFTLTRKEDDEMKLGSSVSRIIVPHPILLEPGKIQVQYNAYSGWLTSGLTQWRIDKITLSDSFGRSSSVCKKNLVLESGVPVTLPLYPGECNLPKEGKADNRTAANDEAYRTDERTKNVTEKNPLRDAFDIFSIPWNADDNNNNIDSAETEQSRAFNTRIVKMTRSNATSSSSSSSGGAEREIVEPVLRPHAMKIGRSHDLSKPEITEPILGPTTARISTTTRKSSSINGNRELFYNFYDVGNESDWIPAPNPTAQTADQKWKRQDDGRSPPPEVVIVAGGGSSSGTGTTEDALKVIVRTVQILPQRLARVFEEAEKYARETILPFVSTYTPKFITDFITPKEPPTPKYLPLKYNEAEPHDKRLLLSTSTESTTMSSSPSSTIASNAFESTTRYSNIQKIGKRSDNIGKVSVVYAQTPATVAEVAARKLVDSSEVKKVKTKGGIYVDLPVFDDNYKDIKYIPLVRENSAKQIS